MADDIRYNIETQDIRYNIDNPDVRYNIEGANLVVNYGTRASDVSFTPSGTISSSTVQTAIQELDTEKVPTTRTINSKALSSDITLNKSDVGLSNADNTSDLNKPISTATQTALDSKVSATITSPADKQFLRYNGSVWKNDPIAPYDIGTGTANNTKYLRGDGAWSNLDKTAVGLGNVDNTSDANKPVSTAQQAALDGKYNITGGNVTGNVTVEVDNARVIFNRPSGGSSQYSGVRFNNNGTIKGQYLYDYANDQFTTLDGSGNPLIQTLTGTKVTTFYGNTTVSKDAPRLVLNRPTGGTNQVATIQAQDNGTLKMSLGYDYTNNYFTILDNLSANVFDINIATRQPIFRATSVAPFIINSSVKVTNLNADLLDGYDWLYVQSRGQNLVTNGFGLLNSNYNFSTFTFDAAERYTGGGSFQDSTHNSSRFNDELISINPGKYYEMSYWIKSPTATYIPQGAYHYGAIASYDIDGNAIQPMHTMYQINTTTTLAAPLKVGDTTVTLVSASGWNNAAGASTWRRGITIWGYKDSKGHVYGDPISRPEDAYSRWVTLNAYADGGINYTTQVITLSAPWSLTNPDDPVNGFPVGTVVSNSDSGSSYKYVAASNIQVTDTWTFRKGTIGGYDTTGNNFSNAFHPGTAYIKLVYLLNRAVGGSNPTYAGNKTNISAIEFGINEFSTWYGAVTPPTIWTANNDGTGSGLDADLLDGLNNTDFVRRMKAFANSRAGSATAGWYRIGVQGPMVYNSLSTLNGRRATGIFTVRTTASGTHDQLTFIASFVYGQSPTITLLNRSKYNGQNIDKIRMVYGQTYDGCAVEIYLGRQSDLFVECHDTITDMQAFDTWTVSATSTVSSIPAGMSNFELDLTGNAVMAMRSNSGTLIINNDGSVTGNNITANGNVTSVGYMKPTGGYQSADGSTGATGSFTSQDGKTITVKNGLVTAIV